MEKLLLTRKEAADALNISVDTLDEIHKAGVISVACVSALGCITRRKN